MTADVLALIAEHVSEWFAFFTTTKTDMVGLGSQWPNFRLRVWVKGTRCKGKVFLRYLVQILD